MRVEFAGQRLLPQEISAFILMKMKQVAEADLGEDVRDAVITVPAYFTDKQRKATEEAALLAGLYPRQLIAEPTAAAICYGLDKDEQSRKVYLIYDLGGGTFDTSIISVEGAQIDVIATAGDPRLGGGDFDDLITAWAVEQLKTSHRLDIGGITRFRSIVKYYAEPLKRELSVAAKAKMTLTELRPENPPTLELTRAEFEKMIDPLLSKSINNVDVALKSAAEKGGVRREDISAILLVGGSSKIPRVKARLLDYFGKDESFVRADCDPDAVVARGAAIMAVKFQPSPGPFDITRANQAGLSTTPDLDLPPPQLITEHSLGVGVGGDLVHKLIDQGSRIPISVKDENFTNNGPSDSVTVCVYQGEGKTVFENTMIGTLDISPIERRPQGHHKFHVTFELDQNGLLKTKVYHVNENRSFEGKFSQRAGVGGQEQLRLSRDRLLRLWTGAAPVTAGPPTPDVPPAGGPPNPNVPPAAAVAPAAAAPAAVAPPPAPDAGPVDVPVAPAAPPFAGVPTEFAAAPAPPPAPADEIAALTGTVTETQKALKRRAEKALRRQPYPPLLVAHNAFVAALNGTTPGADLDDLNDNVEDALLDHRRLFPASA